MKAGARQGLWLGTQRTGVATFITKGGRRNFSSSSFSSSSSSGSTSSNFSHWKKIALLGGGCVTAAGFLVVFAEETPLAPTEQHKHKGKERLVILGSGWAALSLVREVDTTKYDVTVISPRNYFLFTPLLPSVTVGTLEARSVIEPIRQYCRRNTKDGAVQFYEAACKEIDAIQNRIECEDLSDVVGAVQSFSLDYDVLVVAVGSQNVTFNTPGADKYCLFLKELPDAIAIRNRVIDALETANLPGQPVEEIKRLLSFVVVGGGPTGVEFAAELHDFLVEDLRKHYPPELLSHFSITVIQSADTILNTYDAHISKYAQEEFARHKIQVKTLARVTEITDRTVTYFDKATNQKVTLPYGLCVWAAGIGPVPVVSNFIKTLPAGAQTNNKAIVTDDFLRVKGAKNVYAIGDCSTIDQEKLIHKFSELFDQADVNKDGKLSLEELKDMILKNQKAYPQIRIYADHAADLFAKGDVDKDGSLDRNEFEKLMRVVDSELLPLPATAQVAAQQGTYLGDALNARKNGKSVEPFKYRHMGAFAYIGGRESVLELPGQWQFGGFVAWWMWRTTYLSKQVSWRNKTMVAFDWSKELAFGRDVSRF